MKLTNDSSLPLYMQVYNYVLARIESGDYKVGDLIPSQSQLSELCGVSVVTVRKALEKLAEDEIIFTKHGKGSFVTMENRPVQIFLSGSFSKTCRDMNVIPETRILLKSMQVSKKTVASALGIPVGDEVVCIERLRLADHKECILETDYFTKDYLFLLEEMTNDRSLLNTLSRHCGIREVRFNDFLDIVYATTPQAQHLDCTAGSPLLRACSVVTDQNGQVLYYNEQIIRTDRYKYAVITSAVLQDE